MGSISPAEAAGFVSASSVWRSLGGPSTTHLFVHSTVSLATADHLAPLDPGYELYGERSLLLARPQDIVCLAEPVDGDYVEFLGALGAGVDPSRIIVVPASPGDATTRSLSSRLLEEPQIRRTILDLIDPRTQVFLHPFVATASDHLLARNLAAAIGRPVTALGGVPDLTARADCKHLVRAQAKELGLPLADGEVVSVPTGAAGEIRDLAPLRAAIHRRLAEAEQVVIRGSHGASGSATWVVDRGAESIEHTLAQIGERSDNDVFLVDDRRALVASPNVQMHIDPDDGRISCVGITDQELDRRLHHCGNRFPSRAATLDEMVLHAGRLSEWLRSCGFRGLLGIDFGECLDSRDGRPRPFFAELNPRINAATYALSLAEQLGLAQERQGGPPLRAFVAASFATPARSFSDLHCSRRDLFFNPHTGSGIVPYNLACLRHGRCSVLICAGPGDETDPLRAELEGGA